VTRVIPEDEGKDLDSVKKFCKDRWKSLAGDLFLIQYLDEERDLISIDTAKEFAELLETKQKADAVSLKLYIKEHCANGEADADLANVTPPQKRPLEEDSAGELKARKKRKVDSPKKPKDVPPLENIEKEKLESKSQPEKKVLSEEPVKKKEDVAEEKGNLKAEKAVEAKQKSSKSEPMSEDEEEDDDEGCLEKYIGATAMCDWEGKMLLVDVTDIDHEENALIIQWRLDRAISTVPLSELEDIRLKREDSSDEGDAGEELETENGDSETEGESTVSENEEEEVIEEAKSTQRRKLRSNRSSKYRGVTWCNRRKNWLCRVKWNGRLKYVGYFDSEMEAALKHDERARKLYANNLNAIALNFRNKKKSVKLEPGVLEVHKVERILEERYNKKRKRKEWLVKWDGFSRKEATWEPFENLDGNEKFTNYCKGSATLEISETSTVKKEKLNREDELKEWVGMTAEYLIGGVRHDITVEGIDGDRLKVRMHSDNSIVSAKVNDLVRQNNSQIPTFGIPPPLLK